MHTSIRGAVVLSLFLGRTALAATDEADATEAPVEESTSIEAAWLETIQRAIQDSEYRPRAKAGGFEASNRAHNLRIDFGAAGVGITSREANNLALNVRLSGIGTQLAVDAAAAVVPVEGVCPDGAATDETGSCIPRVEYARAGVTEWWTNRPAGVEHGFTLTESPAGGGHVVLDVAFDGMSASLNEGGTEVSLRNADGQTLQYGGLFAFDANGLEIPVWFESSPVGVSIVVDAANATWPVTIDPLSSSPKFLRQSELKV